MSYLELFHNELEKEGTQYFILDTSGSNGDMGDIDYKEYRWETNRYNLVHEGDLFIYRRQSKVSEIPGQFYFFGAGKIEKIVSEGEKKVKASISKPFPFKNVLLRNDLSNYKWSFKNRGETWEHFFNQYGMNKINKSDFLGLLKEQDDSTDNEELDLEVELYQNLLQHNYFVEDKKRNVKTRGSAQKVFSDQVKKNYNFTCAISGIRTRDFLTGSHIVPWSVDKSNRINPKNGICLSSLLDKAFDKGYISFDDNYCLIISDCLKEDEALYNAIVEFSGKKIRVRKEYAPDKEFLKWHRENWFKK